MCAVPQYSPRLGKRVGSRALPSGDRQPVSSGLDRKKKWPRFTVPINPMRNLRENSWDWAVQATLGWAWVVSSDFTALALSESGIALLFQMFPDTAAGVG